MKALLLSLCLVWTVFWATPGFGQDAAVAEPFSGKIVFHQSGGNGVVYEVNVANGQVSGVQHMSGNSEPIAKIVGGWFDFQKGRLSLLIQGTAEGMDLRWRSQCQQFQIDLKTREVTLEHMLYDYGAKVDSSSDTPTPHVLDSLDAVTHLVKTE